MDIAIAERVVKIRGEIKEIDNEISQLEDSKQKLVECGAMYKVRKFLKRRHFETVKTPRCVEFVFTAGFETMDVVMSDEDLQALIDVRLKKRRELEDEMAKL